MENILEFVKQEVNTWVVDLSLCISDETLRYQVWIKENEQVLQLDRLLGQLLQGDVPCRKDGVVIFNGVLRLSKYLLCRLFVDSQELCIRSKSVV